MPPPNHPGPTDKEIDLSVAAMLRFGVTLAGVVVFLGGLLSLRHPRRAVPDYLHFHPDAALSTIASIVRGAFHLDPPSIIQLGLLLLIATPVVRVIFCVVGFARQRDRLYVAISATVLAILLFSLIKAGR
jgi:uncharacterized membrane protein